MTLSVRWIEDAERRPRGKQVDLFQAPRFCCAEVARLRGWSWGRAARAVRAQLEMEPGASMRGVRIGDEVLRRV